MRSMLVLNYLSTLHPSHCQNNGGTCEPMFGCLLNQGYMSGACGGFLQVCCVQPSFQSRRFKENSIFGSGPPPVRIKSAQKVRIYLKKTCAKFMSSGQNYFVFGHLNNYFRRHVYLSFHDKM